MCSKNIVPSTPTLQHIVIIFEVFCPLNACKPVVYHLFLRMNEKVTEVGRGLKVLHTIHNFHPETKGGIETYLLDLVRAQKNLGVHPAIYSGSERTARPGRLEEGEYEDIKVYRYLHPDPKPYPLEGKDPEAGRFFREVLLKEEPDIVHVHHWYNLTTNLVDTASGHGIPCFVTLHDYYFLCPLFFMLKEDLDFCGPLQGFDQCPACLVKFERFEEEDLDKRFEAFRNELEKASAVFTISSSEHEILESTTLLDRTRLYLLPLPRPLLKGFTSRVPPAGVPGDYDLKILNWGGLVRAKGLGTVVEACAMLENRERILVHHWGKIIDEEFKEELLRKARGTGLEFKGRFTEEQMYSIFPSYDVAALPSFFHETHGYTTDEAIMLGLPVIVSDRGAPKERIGKKGICVKAGDSMALAEIFRRMMEDKGFLERLKNGEPTRVPSVEEHTGKLLELYRQGGRK